MSRLYFEYCGVSFHSEIRRSNWSSLIPDVRYGLAVGSCRVHLGWGYVLTWSSYSRVRGYCNVRYATPGLRSLRLFVVVLAFFVVFVLLFIIRVVSLGV